MAHESIFQRFSVPRPQRKITITKPTPFALFCLMGMTLQACSLAQSLPQPINSVNTLRSSALQNRNQVSTRYPQVSPEQQTVPGEWVLRLKPGVRSQQNAALNQLGLQSLRSIGPESLGMQVVRTPFGSAAAESALQRLKARSDLLWIEPLTLERLAPLQIEKPSTLNPSRQTYPNDPLFAQQYGHVLTQSQAGWQIYQGHPQHFLAVIDSGLDLKHPDLAEKLLPGYDVLDQDDQPWDGYGHGTHCAGIAAALTDNGVGIAGYAPSIKIMPIRVIGDNGIGDSADVAAGIIWAVDHGAKVISMSLGGLMNPLVKREAVQYALDRDVLIVAAMGNNGKEMKAYPAAQPGVLAVGASDAQDQRSTFSQFGDWMSLSAPGVKILSALPTYPHPHKELNYGIVSGTSMATPAVAGAAALLRSRWPQLSREEIKAKLEAGADDRGEPGFDTFLGHGRLNLAKALR
jgi:thermitase